MLFRDELIIKNLMKTGKIEGTDNVFRGKKKNISMENFTYLGAEHSRWQDLQGNKHKVWKSKSVF